MVGRFLSANGEILSFIYPQNDWFSKIWRTLLDHCWQINDNSSTPLKHKSMDKTKPLIELQLMVLKQSLC